MKLIATNELKAAKEPVTSLLMSGGVDSSVSAHLLKEIGHSVVGVTMQVRRTEDGSPGKAVYDAAEVARQLGIPHYWVDVTDVFEEMVVEKFRRSYASGITPNPCVDCNVNIKFGLLWELAARELGATKIATGHYARVIMEKDKYGLAKAVDKTKDQSYFLSGITREKFANIIFPLGQRTKVEARRMADVLGLHVAQKTESMELCFAGEGDYRAMLGLEHADNQGQLLNTKGQEIGMHRGVANYTIGQRRGLGFAGGEPLYVGAIDHVKNTVTLGTRQEVCRHVVTAEEVNVLIPDEMRVGAQVMGKVRSYGDGRPCTVVEAGAGRLTVKFDDGEFAPCPGQRLVIYDDRECVIAGGTIVGSEA